MTEGKKESNDHNRYEMDIHQHWTNNAGTMHEVQLDNYIDNEGGLENFESFSKNYITFKGGAKDSSRMNSGNQNQQATSHRNNSRDGNENKRNESTVLTNRNNYADRYLMMMKKRRKSNQRKEESPNKSGKKRTSVFDEIRHQAVNKVHSRFY